MTSPFREIEMWCSLDSTLRMRVRGFDLEVCRRCQDFRVHAVSEIRHYPRWLGIHLTEGKRVGGCLECGECGTRLWREPSETMRFHHSPCPATLVACLRPREQRQLLGELQERSRWKLSRSSSGLDHLRRELLRLDETRGRLSVLVAPTRVGQFFWWVRVLLSILGCLIWLLGSPLVAVGLGAMVLVVIGSESWSRERLVQVLVDRATQRLLKADAWLEDDLRRHWHEIADVLPALSRDHWESRFAM